MKIEDWRSREDGPSRGRLPSILPMPPQESSKKDDDEQTAFSRQTNRVRSLFAIPSPVKKLFDKVPMVVYPPNDLPQRAPKSSRIPSLYVFSSDRDAAAGKPSFNPGCLKWQVSFN